MAEARMNCAFPEPAITALRWLQPPFAAEPLAAGAEIAPMAFKTALKTELVMDQRLVSVMHRLASSASHRLTHAIGSTVP